MSCLDIKLKWKISREKIRNHILIQEQKNTDMLNVIKKTYDLDEGEHMDFEIDKYNIYSSLYDYSSVERWYEYKFCYKYKSQLMARWKLLKQLKYDEFSYVKIFKENENYVILIKLSNQEVLYIYNNKINKSFFHFENIEKFYDLVKSDEKYHLIFELSYFRKFLNT